MMRPEKAVQWLLRIDAVVLVTAFIPVAMPTAWMQEIHRRLGMGELPTGSIVEYLTRSLSLLYAVHGVFLFWLAADVRRYLPLVKLAATLAIVFGAAMLPLDIAAGMPLYWILGEGPWIAILGCLILTLACRIPPARGY